MNDEQFSLLVKVCFGLFVAWLAFMVIFGLRLVRFFWRIFDRERERQHRVYVVEAAEIKRARRFQAQAEHLESPPSGTEQPSDSVLPPLEDDTPPE